jgi:acetyl esterase/lipase
MMTGTSGARHKPRFFWRERSSAAMINQKSAARLRAVACMAFLLAGTSARAQAEFGLEVLPPPAQPNTIALPSSERVDREIWSLSSGRQSVRNVNRATLTVFRPTKASDTASVIIAPGGAFLGLEMDKEGWEVARWFAAQGVIAFVLKYRTLPTPRDQTLFIAELQKMIHGQKSVLAPPADTPPEALADAEAAIAEVRARSASLHIDPSRVGFMGFSAGGFIARSLAEKGGALAPDFVAPIYPNMAAITVPADAPPMFVAVAADDFLLARVKGFPLIDSYRAAGKSVEFHMFAKGGHGFAVGPAGSPAQGWLDMFLRWLHNQKVPNK